MAHAYQEPTPSGAYLCGGCDGIYKGQPAEVEGFNTPGEFVPEEDIENYRVKMFACHDVPPCQVREEYIDALEEIWVCGDCGSWYGSSDEAAECC